MASCKLFLFGAPRIEQDGRVLVARTKRLALQTGAADVALRYFQEGLQAHERA